MKRSLPPRRIVVGVDGSAASNAALDWAVREAGLRDTVVHLVCACHSDTRMRAPYASASWAAHHGELRAAAQALLDRMTAAARRSLPAERLIAELADESPARALLRCASGAEMLVVGATRGGGTARRQDAALGPVARACVRMARCPVVVVASGDLAAGSRVTEEITADIGAEEAGASHGYLQGRGESAHHERGGADRPVALPAGAAGSGRAAGPDRAIQRLDGPGPCRRARR